MSQGTSNDPIPRTDGGRSIDGESVVDVRGVHPPERHPRIFGAFTRLAPGESFILVNDHDPRPLYYQFQAELTGQFSWEYLERGPTMWQVRIGRAEPGDERSPLPRVP